jgi:serine/threonine-protein kinase
MRADIDRALAGQRVAAPVVPVDATARFLPPDEAPPYPAGDYTGEQPAANEMTEKEKRNRRLAYILLTVAVVFVLGVAAYIIADMMGGEKKVQDVLVPTLAGRTVDQARVDLAAKELTVGAVNNVTNDEIPKGQIISTDPAAGAPVPPNTAVALTVSAGQELIKVPPVVGLSLEEARKQLEGAGFVVKEQEDEESDAEDGKVTAVDPPEGSQHPAQTIVTVTYSAGTIEVPRVVGMTEQVAEATLVDKGFKVKRDYQETADEEAGIVIEQVPGDGERKKQGSTVTIIVATEPEVDPSPSETPNPEPTNTGENSPSPDPSQTTGDNEEEGPGLPFPGRNGPNSGEGILTGWTSWWRNVFG